LFDEDDDGKSTGFIESVHTSPALSPRALSEQDEDDLPLNQVNLKLDPSTAQPASAPEQPVASTSTVAAAAAVMTPAEEGTYIEAIRRFRKQEADNQSDGQSYACPVPGCGQRFDKQHLLRR
jgi:hypothetical protein